MQKPIRVIIDNDGGTDDYALIRSAINEQRKGNISIEALTLVAGNAGVNDVARANLKALEMSEISPEEAKKIGIYLPQNVNNNIISDGAQGDNGLGGVKYSLKKGYNISQEKAENMLIQIVNDNPGEITILATGPLTNIAKVIDMDSRFVNNVKEIVIMGGDEGGGNIRPYAEFNIFQDPEAAKKVFEAGFKNITMIGFNVTKHVTLGPELEEFTKNQVGEKGKFFYDITRVTADLDRNKNKVDGASMNDPLTLLYLLQRDKLFSSKKADVDVDVSPDMEGNTRGKTNILEGNTCNVITGANEQEVLRALFTDLYPDKEEEIDKALKKRLERIEFMNFIVDRAPESKKETLRKLLCSEDAWKVIKRIGKITHTMHEDGIAGNDKEIEF